MNRVAVPQRLRSRLPGHKRVVREAHAKGILYQSHALLKSKTVCNGLSVSQGHGIRGFCASNGATAHLPNTHLPYEHKISSHVNPILD